MNIGSSKVERKEKIEKAQQKLADDFAGCIEQLMCEYRNDIGRDRFYSVNVNPNVIRNPFQNYCLPKDCVFINIYHEQRIVDAFNEYQGAYSKDELTSIQHELIFPGIDDYYGWIYTKFPEGFVEKVKNILRQKGINISMIIKPFPGSLYLIDVAFKP